MINSLKGQLADWKYGRGIILKFITELSDNDLDKKLPRQALNTIRLQIEELAVMQSNYITALSIKKISFGWNPIEDTSKRGLIARLSELDDKLEKALETFDGNETIDWFGEQKNIHEHISAMIGHEQMHIGQIIAFCYATEIHIPNDITKTMVLNG